MPKRQSSKHRHYCFYLPHLKVKLVAGGDTRPNTKKWNKLTFDTMVFCCSEISLSFTKGWLCSWYALSHSSRWLTLFLCFLIYSSVATTTSDNQAKEGAALSQPVRCTLWPRTRHQSSFPAWSKSSPPDNAVWLGRERWSVDPAAASTVFFQSRNTESHCLDQWYSYVTLCKGRHLQVQKINDKHSNHIFLIHYTKLEE